MLWTEDRINSTFSTSGPTNKFKIISESKILQVLLESNKYISRPVNINDLKFKNINTFMSLNKKLWIYLNRKVSTCTELFIIAKTKT